MIDDCGFAHCDLCGEVLNGRAITIHEPNRYDCHFCIECLHAALDHAWSIGIDKHFPEGCFEKFKKDPKN